MSIEWQKIWEEITKNSAIAILGPAAAYAGTLAKNWIEQSNARARQASLCDEADRLIKFHDTLSQATVPSSNVQSAKVAVITQLNQVLDRLCHDFTPVPGTSKHASPTIVRLENWLLLYRPLGVLSALLHLLFYLMVPLWCLILYVDFQPDTIDLHIGGRIAMAIFFTLPLVLCNYLARKVDSWTRRKLATAAATARVAPS